MTRDQFKNLQIGDNITHRAYSGKLGIVGVEAYYEWPDGPGTKPTRAAHTVTVYTPKGEMRLKIDDIDVYLAKLVTSEERTINR